MTRRHYRQRQPALSPQRLGRIRTLLLGWYDEHAQEFPWRTARDPYAALVAAVCSQQTQMSRVLPLYERWMAAFPALGDAAAASRAAVLRVWGRAGYPRRALALCDAAAACAREHGGVVPREPAALLALPGVGPFTAGIVRCFGFGEEALAIDTNVVRVVGRIVHGDLQPARETPASAIAEAAERLLRPGTAARWNPALMDYGARVCTPRPHCERCVVEHLCAARPRFARGEVAEPVRAQGPFEHSDRQRRGRILRELRARHRPMRVSELLRTLASPTGDTRTQSIEDGRRLLRALCAERLAWSRGGWCGLGDPPARQDGQSATLPARQESDMPQVYGDDQVTIEHIPALGWGSGNNSYIVRPAGGGAAVIVDVPGGFEAVLEALGDDEVSAIVLTHSHSDHWNGVDVLRSRISAPIYAGAEDAHIDRLHDVRELADGDQVPVGGAALSVLHTPGHTPGSICLLINGAVLTGDTLFPGGPGHSFSPGALRQEIASITSKLYPLPDDTLLLPGHGDGATIGVSRAEYEIFAAKDHADDLHGDVLWLES